MFIKCTNFIATLHFISSRGDKLSSDDAVKRVLAGEKAETKGRSSLTSKPQELDNKNVREEASRVPKDKAVSASHVRLKMK